VSPLPLPEVVEESRFGGKATHLGAALRAGLPVPPGVALAVDLVEAFATGDRGAAERCRGALEMAGAPAVAVRSSAVGEDSSGSSFAGQHVTRLNVTGADSLLEAVGFVRDSGRSAGALAYRARMGIDGSPRVAVVVQAMVQADIAGVLFTRDPIDGGDVRVIEAAWGLGEAVVGGLVEPDRFRMARGGEVTDIVIGDKDVRIAARAGGDTGEVAVEQHLRRECCLDPGQLRRLEALADRCEQVFGGAHDIEWAFAKGKLYLLQRRAITR
jgi:pyruvate, water dikinase